MYPPRPPADFTIGMNQRRERPAANTVAHKNFHARGCAKPQNTDIYKGTRSGALCWRPPPTPPSNAANTIACNHVTLDWIARQQTNTKLTTKALSTMVVNAISLRNQLNGLVSRINPVPQPQLRP